MTITFHKRQNESDQPSGERHSELCDQPSEERHSELGNSSRPLTASAKRQLRRERINAAKNGIIIPYDPQPRKPVDPNAPKLTNTGKRMARKRKKYAAELAKLGLSVEEGGPTYHKTVKKKKNTNPPAVVVSSDSKLTKAEKKKAKKQKKAKKVEESAPNTEMALVEGKDANITNDKPSAIDNTEEGQAVVTGKKKRKKAKKRNKSTPATDKSVEEGSSVVSPPEEITEIKQEIKLEVKLEDEASNEETACDVASNEEMACDETKISDSPYYPARKQRFILFVGNLPYDITDAQIRAHFVKVGKILSVRISKHVDKAMQGTNKGFAHLEVADEDAYMKALSMHHSMLQDRRINVEFSSVQTKDMRVTQKKRKSDMKEAMATGDILDFANPVESKKKKQKVSKNDKRQQKNDNANKVWL